MLNFLFYYYFISINITLKKILFVMNQLQFNTLQAMHKTLTSLRIGKLDFHYLNQIIITCFKYEKP